MKEISLKNRLPSSGADLTSLENGSNNLNDALTANGLSYTGSENNAKKVLSQGILTIPILLIMWCVPRRFLLRMYLSR